MQTDSLLSPCKTLKYKLVKDLHIKEDMLNWSRIWQGFGEIEQKVGKKRKYIGTREIFINKIPVSHAVRSIDKWDLIRLQSFCKTKDTVNRTKLQPTGWERIITNPTSNRGLIS